MAFLSAMLSSVFADSPEYITRKDTPFMPSKITWNELHSLLPKSIFRKSTVKGMSYVVRDVTLAIVLYRLAWFLESPATVFFEPGNFLRLVKYLLWLFYFNAQGILFTSWWCLAHEASHGTLSSFALVNDAVGFVLHTFLLVPYFSWKSSHLSHHASTASVERDENYVPRTRSSFALPPEDRANVADYREAFEETPMCTTFRIVAMQVFGLIFYLLFNRKGSPRHPPGTNHFSPYSSLFKPHERSGVVMSDIGLTFMVYLLYQWTKQVGFGHFFRSYCVPYLLTNHWIVMLTYLQHTDPTVPYYRRSQWNFVRGALASVDRPFLGWIGRVFFHNVSHNHISHHLFSAIPFYNQPLATACIKKILRKEYNYDSTNSFRALYRSFTECEFVEDRSDIVFYKNRSGHANRVLASIPSTSS